MKHKPPKTVTGAAGLAERFAALDGAVERIEARRKRALARINARADAGLAPLVEEREAIAGLLEPWWQETGRAALAGSRKSAELGGCMIGSRAGKPQLVHGYDGDDAAVAALRATRWSKQTTRIKYSLDRAATAKLITLGGKAGAALAELGFRLEQGERFFVERVQQPGTMAGS